MKDTDIAKKLVYLAAGYAALGKHKVEDMASDILQNSEMTQDEGKKFIDELSERTKEAREELEAKMEEVARKVLDKMHIATTDELAQLEARIAKLEAAQSSVEEA